MEQQFGLETYITQNGKNNGVYVSFPTTRKAIRRAFKKAHIPLNDWKVAALKTGSDAFQKRFLNAGISTNLTCSATGCRNSQKKNTTPSLIYATPAAPKDSVLQISSILRQITIISFA